MIDLRLRATLNDPSKLVCCLFGNDAHIAASCDLQGYMALSVRSPQAMAIRMFEVPFRPSSRMEQVAEPSSDRAMRSNSQEQASDMGVVHSFAQCDPCGIARSCFPTSSKKAENHSLAYGHLLCLSPLIERHNQKEIRRAYWRQRVVVGSYGPGWSDSGDHQQLTSRLHQSLPRFLSRFPFPHPFTSSRSAKPRCEAGVPQVLRRPLR